MPLFKYMGHGLTTEINDVAAVFVDKRPGDGHRHHLHMEEKAGGGENPVPPGGILVTTFLAHPLHCVFCRSKPVPVTAPLSRFTEFVFQALCMAGFFSGVTRYGVFFPDHSRKGSFPVASIHPLL